MENITNEMIENAIGKIDFDSYQDNILDKVLKAKKIYETKLNILIIGKTGVGKSTLINTIFGKKIVEARSGSPVTQGIEEIKINENFFIYDTKGLEVKDYAKTKEEIEKFLEEDKQKQANDKIKLVWLCIAEPIRRVEQAEKELFELFKKFEYPVMIVITKAIQDKDENGEKFSDFVKNEFKIDESSMQRVVALSVEDDDGNKTPKKGIEELIKKSMEKLPELDKIALIREQKYTKKLKYETAKGIINKYSGAASLIAASPIPFSDFPLLLAEEVAMIVHISGVYDIEITKEKILEFVVATAVTGGVGMVARSLLKLIPGLGIAINTGAAIATVKLLGEAYLLYLDANFDKICKGEFELDLNDDSIKEYIEKNKE